MLFSADAANRESGWMRKILVSFAYGAFFNRLSTFLSVSHLYSISAHVTHSQVFPHTGSGSHIKIGFDMLYLGHIDSSASKPRKN